jgi:hypothetical protein
LVRAVAYKMQEQSYGGLPAAIAAIADVTERHARSTADFTVRQALGMRSGLPDFGDADSTALLHDLLANCGRHWKPLDTLAYAKGPPSAPGTHVTYSSPNYLLLAVLIEKLTGGPLAGLPGLVAMVSKQRVIVLMQLLGEETRVALAPGAGLVVGRIGVRAVTLLAEWQRAG